MLKKIFKSISNVMKKENNNKNKDKNIPNNNKNGNGNENNGENTPPPVKPGDCFFHKESRKIYQVTGFEAVRLKDETILPIVVYVGVDSRVRKLNIIQFLEKFQRTFAPKHSTAALQRAKNLLDINLEPTGGESGEEDYSKEDDVLLGELYTPSDIFVFKNMVIYPKVEEEIDSAITSIIKHDEIEKIWGISRVIENSRRNIINFYGPSGTGKTMAAKCLAKKLNKKLYQVDYSQVVDKYVGETAKKISQIFAIAKEKDAILFLDEADSLLSKRVDMNINSDYANSVNQNRNVFMQEIDKFDGIVVMSSNFFNNYDEAMLRRINSHIEFELPNEEMRERLFKIHFGENERIKNINFSKLSKESEDFSGGDILNVFLNSIRAASKSENTDDWVITEDILLSKIESIKNSKKEHKKSGSNNRTRNKKFIGFKIKE